MVYYASKKLPQCGLHLFRVVCQNVHYMELFIIERLTTIFNIVGHEVDGEIVFAKGGEKN